MTTIFSICAAIGGTVLVCQFLLTLLGLTEMDDIPDDLPEDAPDDLISGAGEVGHGDLSAWLFGMITFRTLVAAVTFFGLAGLAASSADFAAAPTMAVAIGAGLGAMVLVHWVMQTLYRLRSDGTVRIERAIGQNATVYLRVPGEGAGQGKVTVVVHGRSLEINAQTAGEALPTGATVKVIRVLNNDTVEVAPVEQTSGV